MRSPCSPRSPLPLSCRYLAALGAACAAVWAVPLLLMLCVPEASAASGAVAGSEAARAAEVGEPTAAALAFPVAFEANAGQYPEEVEFAVRARRVVAAVVGQGFDVYAGAAPIRVRWLGTTDTGSGGVRGEQRMAGRVNHLRGSSREDWILDVARHARVRHSSVWPGIDVVFRGSAGQIEYDFVLAAGADPAVIGIAVSAGAAAAAAGHGAARLAPDGTLRIGDAADPFRISAPIAYQVGAEGHEPVAARFVDTGAGRFGIEVANYDAKRELVIDPVVLGYSTRLGGSGGDQVEDTVIGPSGSLYLAGNSTSADFPGAGATPTVTDAWVVKLTPDGSALDYVSFLGGDGFDTALGLDVDAAGHAYVSGHTESTDFPTVNAFQGALAGGADAFLTRLDASGVPVFSTYYGGSDLDGRFIGGVAVGPSGIAYLAGRTQSMTDLPVLNPFHTACVATPCSFAAGFDTALSGAASHVYGTYIAGNSSGGGIRLGVDAAENLYVFGFTGASAGLIDPAQGFQAATGDVSNRDHYLIKLDPSLVGGAQRVYSTYIGAPGDEPEAGDIDVRADGVVLVTGTTDSDAALPDPFPTANPFQATNAGSEDGYALKIDTTQTGAASLLWGTFLGTTGSDSGNGIAFDGSGGAWIALSAGAAGLPLVAPLPMFDAPPLGSALIVHLSADGQTLELSTPVAAAVRVADDGSGGVWVAGQTTDPAFALEASLPPSPIGGADLAIARLDPVTAGLSLTVSDSADPVDVSERYAVREEIRNAGPDPESAAITLMTDTLPGAVVGERPAPCFNSGGGLECSFEEEPLAPGENITVWLVGANAIPGSATVSATVSSPNADPDPSDNSDDEATTASAGAVGVPAGVLREADFDATGAKEDIGAFAIETARGVMATANGSLDDGYNFMVFDGSMPLHIVEIFSQGRVAFGFVERNDWTPGTGTSGDLIGELFDAPVDRVFALVDPYGRIELRSASAFTPGALLVRAAVDLDPDRAFALVLDKVSVPAVLTLSYDGVVVAQADPFPAAVPDVADPLQVGDDFVVSVGQGNGFLGGAVIANAPAPVADADGDGVGDASDNCPEFANGSAEAAVPNVGNQLDSDGDGIGDACGCGDVDLDGFTDATDISTYRGHLADPFGMPFSALALGKCNVIAPVRPCDLLDVVVMTRALAVSPLPPGIAQVCQNAVGSPAP